MHYQNDALSKTFPAHSTDIGRVMPQITFFFFLLSANSESNRGHYFWNSMVSLTHNDVTSHMHMYLFPRAELRTVFSVLWALLYEQECMDTVGKRIKKYI